MNIEVQKQKSTPLLSRERVTGFVHYESGATPSRVSVRDALAKKIKKDAQAVVVRHVYQRFGENKAKIIAHVYDDMKMMKQLEPETLLKKHAVEEKKEEPAKQEATAPAAEEKKEEAPQEAPAEAQEKAEPAKEEATPEAKAEEAAEEKKEE